LSPPVQDTNMQNAIEAVSGNILPDLPALQKEIHTSRFWLSYRGLLLSVFYAFLRSIIYSVVKSLDNNYHPITVSLYRNASMFLPALLVLLYFKIFRRDTPILVSVFHIDSRKKVVLALVLLVSSSWAKLLSNLWNFELLVATCGAFSRLFHAWSQKYLTIGDCTILSSATPILVVFFSSICLGEKCGHISVGIMLVTLFGIILMVRPPLLTGQSSVDMSNFVSITFFLILMLPIK